MKCRGIAAQRRKKGCVTRGKTYRAGVWWLVCGYYQAESVYLVGEFR